MTIRRPRKVVLPAAGLGTRFLPATKAAPKEMLPIVDRPVIQYVVEEAIASGLADFVIVTGRGKRAIEDHFDASAELEAALRAAGKEKLLEEVQRVSELGRFAYVRQKRPRGLGDAVLCAADWVGEEPFAVMLADELILHEPPALAQLLHVHEITGGASVIGLARVPKEEIGRYGVAAVKQENGLLRITGLVEKPAPGEAPSDLAVIGRYVLAPRVFALLAKTPPGRAGEVQLTDALDQLAREEPVYGVLVEGERFDVGTPEGFLAANLALGLRDPRYGKQLAAFARRLLGML